MAEEGEGVDLDSGWSCCCLALASSLVATCCLTNERAEAEIENKARKEEKRRQEFKKIQEDIRRKEEKRRDDERRRKEERRRKDEKKRIEKQQKEEKTKRALRENEESGGGQTAGGGSENIQKLQAVRAANLDINRRDKIQWETKPGGEKHEISGKPEIKKTSSLETNKGHGQVGDRMDRLNHFDGRTNLSAGNHGDHSLQKVGNNFPSNNHSSSTDANHGGGLGTKRLQSLHSLDGSQFTRMSEGHPRERLRSIHSLDGGRQHQQFTSGNNGQIGQHGHGQLQRKTGQGQQHGPGNNGNGPREQMHVSQQMHGSQQQVQQKKALAQQRQKSVDNKNNNNNKKSCGGKLAPGKKR